MSFKKQVLNLRNAGASYSEIVKQLGCSKGLVSYYCSKETGHDDSVSNRQRIDFSSFDCNKSLQLLLEESVSRKHIADALGFNYQHVLKYAKSKGYVKSSLTGYASVKRRRKHIKLLAVAYMGGACAHCGYSKCLRALCFHHLDPNAKDFTIGQNSNRSWKAIKLELDKCALLCHNCHSEEHERLDAL